MLLAVFLFSDPFTMHFEEDLPEDVAERLGRTADWSSQQITVCVQVVSKQESLQFFRSRWLNLAKKESAMC